MASEPLEKARTKGGSPASLLTGQPVAELKEEMKQMQSIFQEIENRVAKEIKQLEEIKEDFERTVAQWRSGLHENQEALRQKESALKQQEELLTARIHDLESQVREKEGFVETRNAELKDLMSRMDAFRASVERHLTIGDEEATGVGEFMPGSEQRTTPSGRKEGETRELGGATAKESEVRKIDQFTRGIGTKRVNQERKGKKDFSFAAMLSAIKRKN